MKVKSIRGSIQYNGKVNLQGEEFEIEEKHLMQMQENVEILSKKEGPGAKTASPAADNPDGKEPDKETDIDYKSLKKAELLQIAEERKLDIPEKATVAEIIEILKVV